MRLFLIIIFMCGSCFAKGSLEKSSIDTAKYIYKYFSATEFKEAAAIITSQTILETGWYRSDIHNEYNNYFSVKRRWTKECNEKPILCMKKFGSLKEQLDYMYRYFVRKGYSIGKDGFFKSLTEKGYAEDPEYNNKVSSVIRSLVKRNII